MSYYIGDKYSFPDDLDHNNYRLYFKNGLVIDIHKNFTFSQYCKENNLIYTDYILHREDGPAFIIPYNGFIFFYINGMEHNSEGYYNCIIENGLVTNGDCFYMGKLLGHGLTKEEHKLKLKELIFK